MSKEILKMLSEIKEDVSLLKQGQEDVKEYITIRDRVTLAEYCALRMYKGKPLLIRTLKDWIAKGCPKEDVEHVSIKAVDNYMRTKHTRKSE